MLNMNDIIVALAVLSLSLFLPLLPPTLPFFLSLSLLSLSLSLSSLPPQVKTAKPHLKQLQQRVKLLSTETTSMGAESAADGSSGDGGKALTADSIQWLTREQTFVIVYLVSSSSMSVVCA